MTAAKKSVLSCKIILDAVQERIAQTGLPQKSIAIDAGVESNYLSMMKKNNGQRLRWLRGHLWILGEYAHVSACFAGTSERSSST